MQVPPHERLYGAAAEQRLKQMSANSQVRVDGEQRCERAEGVHGHGTFVRGKASMRRERAICEPAVSDVIMASSRKAEASRAVKRSHPPPQSHAHSQPSPFI